MNNKTKHNIADAIINEPNTLRTPNRSNHVQNPISNQNVSRLGRTRLSRIETEEDPLSSEGLNDFFDDDFYLESFLEIEEQIFE